MVAYGTTIADFLVFKANHFVKILYFMLYCVLLSNFFIFLISISKLILVFYMMELDHKLQSL